MMRYIYTKGKYLAILTLLLVISVFSFAAENCFIAKEDGHMIKSVGNCSSRFSPCSTFKIAIAIMGFEEGIIIDRKAPEWEFKDGYVDWVESWKQPQTPYTWITNSCVWFSQIITNAVGIKKFKSYVEKFRYGNMDITGKHYQGLKNCWICSTLKISPEEQVAFLEKLINDKLPVTKRAQELARSLLFIEKLPNGWHLYGKTGGGFVQNKDGSLNDTQQIGWFIGWIKKDDRKIAFAQYIQDDKRMGSHASERAKELAKKNIMNLKI